MPGVLQYCSSPARQYSHSRQESTKQPTPTRSPTEYLLTSEPTSETMPAISWPGTMGNMAEPHSSRPWWMSEWQMPANLMSMTTSWARGARRSMVLRSKGWEAPRVTRASAVREVVVASLMPCTVPNRGQVKQNPDKYEVT